MIRLLFALAGLLLGVELLLAAVHPPVRVDGPCAARALYPGRGVDAVTQRVDGGNGCVPLLHQVLTKRRRCRTRS